MKNKIIMNNGVRRNRLNYKKKIQSSNMLNQARLKALKVREDHVRNVLDEARRQLLSSIKDSDRYRDILSKLMLQALYQILEGDVLVKAREVDGPVVSSLFPDVLIKYKEASGKDLQLKLDTENFLPSECAGGIELTSGRGRIKVVNTLESRLDLISAQLVPQIRIALFGRNVNRKFND